MNAIKQFYSYMDLVGIQDAGDWNPYTYNVETIYGPLKVSIHAGDFCKYSGKPLKKHDNFSSIYCAFQDKKCEPFLQKVYGKKFITCYKWNFVMTGGENEIETWTANFERFKSELEKILIKRK